MCFAGDVPGLPTAYETSAPRPLPTQTLAPDRGVLGYGHAAPACCSRSCKGAYTAAAGERARSCTVRQVDTYIYLHTHTCKTATRCCVRGGEHDSFISPRRLVVDWIGAQARPCRPVLSSGSLDAIRRLIDAASACLYVFRLYVRVSIDPGLSLACRERTP